MIASHEGPTAEVASKKCRFTVSKPNPDWFSRSVKCKFVCFDAQLKFQTMQDLTMYSMDDWWYFLFISRKLPKKRVSCTRGGHGWWRWRGKSDYVDRWQKTFWGQMTTILARKSCVRPIYTRKSLEANLFSTCQDLQRSACTKQQGD